MFHLCCEQHCLLLLLLLPLPLPLPLLLLLVAAVGAGGGVRRGFASTKIIHEHSYWRFSCL